MSFIGGIFFMSCIQMEKKRVAISMGMKVRYLAKRCKVDKEIKIFNISHEAVISNNIFYLDVL